MTKTEARLLRTMLASHPLRCATIFTRREDAAALKLVEAGIAKWGYGRIKSYRYISLNLFVPPGSE